MRYHDWILDPCRRWPESTLAYEAVSALLCAAMFYHVVRALHTGVATTRRNRFERRRDTGMFYFQVLTEAAIGAFFGYAALASWTRITC